MDEMGIPAEPESRHRPPHFVRDRRRRQHRAPGGAISEHGLRQVAELFLRTDDHDLELAALRERGPRLLRLRFVEAGKPQSRIITP